VNKVDLRELRADFDVEQVSASGRLRATRWEVRRKDGQELWLGDLVRFEPEHEWHFQPPMGRGSLIVGKSHEEVIKRAREAGLLK